MNTKYARSERIRGSAEIRYKAGFKEQNIYFWLFAVLYGSKIINQF